MNTLITTVKYFAIITVELTVLFLGISTVVALILQYIPQAKIKKWLTRRGFVGNILGALLGALTPFCACSTIPMTLGLLNAGAPFGAVISFVIASPLLNPIIITMIFALMGFKASLIYFGVTFLGSVLLGYFLEICGFVKYVKKVRIKGGSSANVAEENPTNNAAFLSKVASAFKSAWGDYTAVLLYLLIGVAIGSVIYGYIPQSFIVKLAGPDNIFAIPVAATIGVPLYIRAESAIPIGLALLQKGMSIGAVIALIIGGAGMAIPEMTMLASIFKKQLVAVLVVAVWLTAVIGGYLFNFLL